EVVIPARDPKGLPCGIGLRAQEGPFSFGVRPVYAQDGVHDVVDLQGPELEIASDAFTALMGLDRANETAVLGKQIGEAVDVVAICAKAGLCLEAHDRLDRFQPVEPVLNILHGHCSSRLVTTLPGMASHQVLLLIGALGPRRPPSSSATPP